jgi:hypothetical protein
VVQETRLGWHSGALARPASRPPTSAPRHVTGCGERCCLTRESSPGSSRRRHLRTCREAAVHSRSARCRYTTRSLSGSVAAIGIAGGAVPRRASRGRQRRACGHLGRGDRGFDLGRAGIDQRARHTVHVIGWDAQKLWRATSCAARGRDGPNDAAEVGPPQQPCRTAHRLSCKAAHRPGASSLSRRRWTCWWAQPPMGPKSSTRILFDSWPS